MPEMEPQQFLHKKKCLTQWPRKSQRILATFVAKFVAKNFQKSPNLVTLIQMQRVIFFFNRSSLPPIYLFFVIVDPLEESELP